MKLALVLFSGTGSVDRSLEKYGFHVDSLDIDPKCGATWTADILKWDDWRRIDPGTYDYVHASPPCTEYSIARTTARTPRNFELADSIVERTLEIIRYLKPKCYTIENPATGLLKTRDVIQGIPYKDLTYCCYSDGVNHRYRKATRIWGFLPTFVPRPMCTKKNPCALVVNGKHPASAQRFSGKAQGHYQHTLKQLYSMPEQLTDDIAKAALQLVEQSE